MMASDLAHDGLPRFRTKRTVKSDGKFCSDKRWQGFMSVQREQRQVYFIRCQWGVRSVSALCWRLNHKFHNTYPYYSIFRMSQKAGREIAHPSWLGRGPSVRSSDG